MRTVVFDLDGTLADTSGDLIAAANYCFRDMGLGNVLSPQTDAGIALRGGRRMLNEGLTRCNRMDSSIVETYYPVLLDAYGKSIAEKTFFYPGALEAIEELKALGYGVGICTNKPESLADRLLRELGVRDVFGALVGADTLPVCKPDPEPLFETVRRLGGEPKMTVLIGDSDTDRNTARAAGVPSILVTFGPSGEDMASLAPEALLSDFAKLADLVQNLIGRNT
ncbi:HAD-IA family hydrolase [Pseudopelagicola sp. nBUS_19]|uniref:HAD-IA family hydrolase n=1 Tax=Pseudopelagicola sp. nBUS_19 TaxID=3395316 RepID=UPI003EB84EE3